MGMVFTGRRRRKAVALVLVLFSGVVYASEQGEGPAPAVLSGLSILFKQDPRIAGGTYGGERWLSGPTFSSAVQPGPAGTVDVKVRGLDHRGKLVRVVPAWTAADPERITVTPRPKDEFRITVNGPGESGLTVAAQGVTQELLVSAKGLGAAIRVEISQGAATVSSPPDAPAPAPGDSGAVGRASLFADRKERGSYAMGVEMGKKLKDMLLELDADLVSRGVKDAMTGENILSEEETKAALAALRIDFRKKQAEARKQLAETNMKEGEAFLAANKAREGVVTLESGLQYRVLKAGDGPRPAAEDRVVCHYRGTLIDGREFDSSRGKKSRTLALKRAIKGWSEALQLMPVGSRWEIFIPPHLAYGVRGTRGVAANATLIFDVELISIKDSSGNDARARKEEELAEAAVGNTQEEPDKNPGGGGHDDEGCTVDRPADVVAVVNGAGITPEELDELIAEDLIKLHDQIGEARERELDRVIDLRLLDEEARKRGTTSSGLLETEVSSKVTPPTEAEARALYDANRRRFHGAFPDVKDQLVNYLRQQREIERRQELANSLRASATIAVLVEDIAEPRADVEPELPVARVDGEVITLDTIDARLRALVYRIDKEIHDRRSRAVDQVVESMLLEEAAGEQGLSVDAFLDAEVYSGLESISESDLRQFYAQNRNQLQVSYRKGRARILEYMRQRRFQERKSALVDSLRSSASIHVYLEAPAVPPSLLTTGDQPSKGPPDAPVTIVEFIDYECPSCGTMLEVLAEVLAEYPDTVRLVARDFPLQRHANAYPAAIAAEAAREQGKYWEYVRLLFGSGLGPDQIEAHARKLGLDMERFDRALASGRAAEHVEFDRRMGQSIGVLATPTVFVNGQRLDDHSVEAIKAAIERALNSLASGEVEL